MKRLRWAVEAGQELEKAAAWYESKQTGLSTRFLDEIDATLTAVRNRPQSFPILLDSELELEIRRALVPRFPYGILFLDLEDHIRILAVAHHHRRLGYWLDRVELL